LWKFQLWARGTQAGTQAANGDGRYLSLVITRRSIAMFAIQMSRNMFQSVACMLLALVIVTATLAMGTIGTHATESGAHYSVTVTQLS
jgi:hypothetical protein